METYYQPPSAVALKKLILYCLFIGNIVGIVWIWWTYSNYYILNPGGGDIYIALGRIAGLISEYFILVQLVLIGRVMWIERLYGFDKLNRLHRWIGYSIGGTLLAHPILLTIGYAESYGVSFWAQLSDFLANRDGVFLAYFALMIFALVILLSLPFNRKNLRYETWYFIHLLMYVAIGLALNHQLGTADLIQTGPLYYWYALNFIVFGAVLLYRFVRPLARFAWHRFTVTRVVQENKDTWSLYVNGRHLEKFAFEAGQYANLNILAKGMWFTHPFSLSAPYDGASLRFSIKNAGDYTSKIQHVQPGTRVIIDGPLGRFVARNAVRDKYLFIAGGIGITPIRAMIEPLAAQQKDVVLLYTAKTEHDLVFWQELEDIKKQYGTLTIHYVLSAPTTAGHETGRLDKNKIIRLVPDFYEREAFLCGPTTMMEAMAQHLKELGFPKKHIHYEKFSF